MVPKKTTAKKKSPVRAASCKSNKITTVTVVTPENPVRVTRDGEIEFVKPRGLAKPDLKEIIEVELTEEEHEVLLSMGAMLDDRLMEIVKAAEVTDYGFLMKGSRLDIDDLAGWVAGECNHEPKRRRAALLSDACDAIEDALR